MSDFPFASFFHCFSKILHLPHASNQAELQEELDGVEQESEEAKESSATTPLPLGTEEDWYDEWEVPGL